MPPRTRVSRAVDAQLPTFLFIMSNTDLWTPHRQFFLKTSTVTLFCFVFLTTASSEHSGKGGSCVSCGSEQRQYGKQLASIQKVAEMILYIQGERRILKIWRPCVLTVFSNVVQEPKEKACIRPIGLACYQL